MNNMEQQQGNSQELPTPPTLCRASCGFYGTPALEGYCSKCYKDIVKRKQQDPSLMNAAGTTSPCLPSDDSAGPSEPEKDDDAHCTTPSVETATPTVISSAVDKEPQASGSSEATEDDDSPKDLSKKKRNRCHTCKKKVGLTGFQCRCGGLYCSLHRYSDKHGCTFDYKELGQEQIRKANPVVVGEKIQKI